jgi:DNA invertase Pin-like site-specific DNA recombinase
MAKPPKWDQAKVLAEMQRHTYLKEFKSNSGVYNAARRFGLLAESRKYLRGSKSGEHGKGALVSNQIARRIREEYAKGVRPTVLCKTYNLSKSTLYRITSNRTYREA